MPTPRAQGLLSVPSQASAGLPYQAQNAVDLGLLSIAPQKRQYVQALEPFVGSYNPLNPAFRDTIRAGINNLIGGRAIGGTPTQRYRAKMADLVTGLLDVAPGVGDAMGISDTRQAARAGDYGTALLLGGATALGMVPGIGDAASKAVKSGVDVARSAKNVKAVDVSYRGSHTPPDTDYGAPLHDLTKLIPADVYGPSGPRLYGSGDKIVDMQAFSALARAKNNPDAEITIYRAVPKNIDIINPGDWVTTSEQYAKNHGDSALGGSYKILKSKVPAKELLSEGYPYELGWIPAEK